MTPDRNTPDRNQKPSGASPQRPQASGPKSAQEQPEPRQRRDAQLSGAVGQEPAVELTLPEIPVAPASSSQSQLRGLDSAQPTKGTSLNAMHGVEAPAAETPPNPRDLARDLIRPIRTEPQKPYVAAPSTSNASYLPYPERVVASFPKPTELWSDCTQDSFDNIFGHDTAKELLFRRFIAQAKYPQVCAQFQIAPLGTAVLAGLAGTGKSTLLRAAAREAGADCYTITPAHVQGLLKSSMRQGMHELFREIERNRRPTVCVLRNFDQMDGLNTLIQEAHGLRGYLSSAAQVLIVATVTAPWRFSGAGNLFSKVPLLALELPAGPEEREEILRLKLAQAEVAPDLDLPRVASAAARFSGKDLKAVVERAIADQARRGGEARPLTTDDLAAACLKVTCVNSPVDVAQFNTWRTQAARR